MEITPQPAQPQATGAGATIEEPLLHTGAKGMALACATPEETRLREPTTSPGGGGAAATAKPARGQWRARANKAARHNHQSAASRCTLPRHGAWPWLH